MPRTWFKRPRKPLVDVFPRVFFFKISLYAWTLPVKVKMGRFNSMNLWFYRNWSRHATCQNPQNSMTARFSFTSKGKCNSMVKLFTSTGRHSDSMTEFNGSTGEEYCKWFACGTDRFRHKAGWFHTFLSFLPRPASCSRQFTPNGSTAAECTEKKMISMK